MPPSAPLLDVLGPGGRLHAVLPGWESRPAQLEMAAAVEDALARRRPLLVEAGTGTGKTLAYLAPALLSGLKVVVSTGTKNLQEQILKKDVPVLREALPHRFQAVALKGISNYLCLRRFQEHRTAQQALGRSGDADLERLAAWAAETRSGDRGELADLPDEAPLWREVSASAETRLGARCRFYEDCWVTKARRAAQAADLLVVNHHLFFADLALKERWPSAQLLPAYEAVIFDEAHQLEDVATDYFAITVSTLRIGRLVRDLRTAVAQSQLDDRIEGVARHIEAVAEAMFTALRPRLPRDNRAPLSDDAWTGEPTRGWQALDTALEEAEAAASTGHTDGAQAAETAAMLTRRARSIRDDLSLIADHADRGRVYWAETRGRTVFLHASPIDVAESIRSLVLGTVEAAVFTSATLTASGSFDYVRSRLGLEAASELRLDSPFDYAAQALLYLPRDLPEPGDPRFAEAAAARIEALVEASGGRAFLLFTSYRQLQAVHRLLAPRLRVPVHVQGERPKHLLLEAFRAAPSVLFATASFWEGVDVQGEALELVVIDKLPFAPPDDPLVAARARHIEEEGGDGFGSYQVPQAALALAQGFGRLIRSRRDRGVVALLDPRATRRSYGRRVLSSLPAECPRTADLHDACAFLRRIRAGTA